VTHQRAKQRVHNSQQSSQPSPERLVPPVRMAAACCAHTNRRPDPLLHQPGVCPPVVASPPAPCWPPTTDPGHEPRLISSGCTQGRQGNLPKPVVADGFGPGPLALPQESIERGLLPITQAEPFLAGPNNPAACRAAAIPKGHLAKPGAIALRNTALNPDRRSQQSRRFALTRPSPRATQRGVV